MSSLDCRPGPQGLECPAQETVAEGLQTQGHPELQSEFKPSMGNTVGLRIKGKKIGGIAQC